MGVVSNPASADLIVRRYDFGNYGQAVAPGWIDQNYYILYDNVNKIAGKRQVAGNLVGENNGTATFAPIEMYRDYFNTYNLGGSPDFFDGPNPFIFRDYVPDWTTWVTITIHRSSENDPYTNTGDVMWSTTGANDAINNTWTLLDGGTGVTAAYHAPIVSTQFISGASRIDFKFMGYLDTQRVNGIELAFTVPEPASLSLIALAGVMLVRRRR